MTTIRLDGFYASGQAVEFLCVTVILLAVSGVLVYVSRDRELRRRWRTWLFIAPALGLPLWFGRGPTTVLAALIAVAAVREFTRLVRLQRIDAVLLYLLGVGYPAAAWFAPSALTLAPLLAIGCALPAIITGDTSGGFRRACLTAFGSLWLCWSLAHLVLVWHEAFLLCLATAVADVAAWCGGKGLHRFAWARRPLSRLSPNKTLGGLVGGVVGAAAVLAAFGEHRLSVVAVVGIGAVVGDLLESMVKREAGVKDAGSWLPGFGGLLDRIDSLLVVLPLAAVVLR
jgi:phosphatidate cytidylyltransferase